MDKLKSVLIVTILFSAITTLAAPPADAGLLGPCAARWWGFGLCAGDCPDDERCTKTIRSKCECN